MSNIPKKYTQDSTMLAKFLTGRYGALALTRAAGEAEFAVRHGEVERALLLKNVINQLRRSITAIEAV